MNSTHSSLGPLGQIVNMAGFKVHIALTLAAGGTNPALGGNYYVGGAGASDRNPGTASQPLATIQKAAGVAVAGDFINIRAGTYRETITPANSGTPGHPITFQPDGNAVVKVSGADVADGGWTVYRGNIYQKTIALPVTGYRDRITGNTTLLANQVFVAGKMMIEARWPNVAHSDDLLNRADFRPVPKSAWTTGLGTTLRDAGIPEIPGGWTGGTIWFIGWFDQNAKPAQIDHNVFWNNHRNDVRLEQEKPPFHRVFNNTMASTETNFWFTFHSYPTNRPRDSQNNIYRLLIKPNTSGTNEMTSGTDPKFANAGEGGLKYRLQPDSPAIDRGAMIPGVTDGYLRSAPDLGAYEYGGPDWVAGCSINARLK